MYLYLPNFLSKCINNEIGFRFQINSTTKTVRRHYRSVDYANKVITHCTHVPFILYKIYIH